MFWSSDKSLLVQGVSKSYMWEHEYNYFMKMTFSEHDFWALLSVSDYYLSGCQPSNVISGPVKNTTEYYLPGPGWHFVSPTPGLCWGVVCPTPGPGIYCGDLPGPQEVQLITTYILSTQAIPQGIP